MNEVEKLIKPFVQWKSEIVEMEGGFWPKHERGWYHAEYGKYCEKVRRLNKEKVNDIS